MQVGAAVTSVGRLSDHCAQTTAMPPFKRKHRSNAQTKIHANG